MERSTQLQGTRIPRSAGGVRRRNLRARLAALLALTLLLAACGSGISTTTAATETTEASTTTQPTATTDGSSPSETTSPEAEEDLTTLRFGSAPSLSLVPIWLAYENGYFLDENLEIQMEEFNTGGEVTQAIAAGHLDAGIANVSNSVPIAVAGGTPLRAVILHANPTGIYQAARFGVLARADSGVTADNPAAMAGMNVGLQVGGTPDVYFANFLDSLGLSIGDVNIQNIPVTELGVALEQDIVQVGVTWDPFILRHLNDMGDDIVLVQQGGSFASDLSSWIATDELIDERTDVAERMLRAVIRAHLELEEDPTRGAEVATRYISGLTVEEAEAILVRYSFDPRSASVCIAEDIRRVQEELIEDGRLSVSEPFEMEDLVAVDLLNSVLDEFSSELSGFDPLPERAEDCTGF